MNQEARKKLVEDYFSSISDKFQTGQAGEHAYRPAFEALIHALDPTLKILNDPSRSEHGNPDFVFLRGDVTVGYVETKDIGVNLNKTEKTNQMERYLGYSNLILTDYLEFRFFRNGLRYAESICIGIIKDGKLIAKSETFNELADALTDFLTGKPEPIKNGERLAEIMGGKARRIRDNVLRFLADKADIDTDLLRIYESVKKMLVHDLTQGAFADMYAQTLVYGLFVARYHDDSQDTFSRAEARDLVPESNPFLRQFFNHIAGPDFNKRLRYIVDELCVVFACANVRELMDEYFKKNGAATGQDPVIHFYEDFLKEYDAGLRKKMGAYYTPLPVVRFIVRAVDNILKSGFSLAEGLADTSKLSSGMHKVQVLDPAVGTGTFISAVIRIIYERLLKQGQKGRWPTYVHHDLLPRIHGFELMMAPYTIAHLKLSIAFEKTGFKYFNQRLGIYLTNSLEGGVIQDDMFAGFGFAQSIADESKEASKIKNEKPIMVVIGNPPYSVSSSNKGPWIQELIKDYKTGLTDERNIQPLSDDYIKFIRFAEHFIEKNKTGIVAMITNNSFLSGRIHRQMRKHLLETFDDIYILNLHGNSRVGGIENDENVFDIQQGVSINIFVKKNKNHTGQGAVHYSEILGKREAKFEALNESSMDKIKWRELSYSEPYYYFVIKDFEGEDKYNKGFSVTDLFPLHSSGATSAKDDLLIKFSRSEIKELHDSFAVKTDEEIAHKYDVEKNQVNSVRKDLDNIIEDSTEILYRPFDVRYTLYSLRSEGVFSRPRPEVMKHMLKENLGFIAKQGLDQKESPLCFISKYIIDRRSWSRPGMLGAEQLFPLYIFAEDGSKTPNLKKEIVAELEKIISKTTPEDLLDYIYAILHSPTYREKYKEFLKIDFPRVPYPKDKKQFKELSALGRKLREIHLLESPKLNQSITSYPVVGSDIIEKISYKDGKVFINSEQYFGDVPEVAWNFYIGGYQPAQKWLKDRKGRTLTSEEISHYQKIIVALVETDRIMKEIDKIGVL